MSLPSSTARALQHPLDLDTLVAIGMPCWRSWPMSRTSKATAALMGLAKVAL
jgi:hypothetical protein